MKRRRISGGGGDDGDGGGDEAVDAAAAGADAAYRAGRPAAACRRPGVTGGSPLRGPYLQTFGSCPPSGSKCL